MARPIARAVSGSEASRRVRSRDISHELRLKLAADAELAPVGSSLRSNLPGLGRLVIVPVPTAIGEVGVADVSGNRRSVALTFALSGPRFGLADVGEQARALGAWGQLLGALARDHRDLHRVQLTERIAPDDLSAPWRSPTQRRGRGSDPAALAAYREHLELLSGQAVRHEVLLTVTLGHLGRERFATAVATECERVGGLVESAGFSARPLPAIGLAAAINGALDPERTLLGNEVGNVAPRAWQASWGSVRTDSGLHACFEASGLPRLPVGPEWAWPLVLAEAPVLRRSLALHLELARPELAIRRAERAVVSHESDEAVRARFGFRSGAREQQVHEAALDREAELASGFADARFCLLVAASAASEEELQASCRALVSQAASSHVELRRCYGRQAEALVATLPLGIVRLRGGRR